MTDIAIQPLDPGEPCWTGRAFTPPDDTATARYEAWKRVQGRS